MTGSAILFPKEWILDLICRHSSGYILSFILGQVGGMAVPWSKPVLVEYTADVPSQLLWR